MLMLIGSLLTTSPMATSSLFFGLATYGFFVCRTLERLGVAGRTEEDRDCRGARAQVGPVDILIIDLDMEEASDGVGLARYPRWPVCARGRADMVSTGDGNGGAPVDRLLVRWRDE